MPFPQTRLRRLRATGALRGLVRETTLSPSDFVYPMFVAHGIDRREPIDAMPRLLQSPELVAGDPESHDEESDLEEAEREGPVRMFPFIAGAS